MRERRGPDTPAVRRDVVSVVVVNYRGAEDTITCLRHLLEVQWPRELLELIVVDNDSGDGSAKRIRTAVPEAQVIDAGSNTGFAGGCNLGVAAATGEYVAFINNDARPHLLWVQAAVDTLRGDPTIGAVASKVFDWDGQRIDYVDGSLSWFGMGYKREVGRADAPEFDVPKDVLFATGAAMVMRAEVFRDVGGFDERFFMFYEDVDLGWRLNVLGYRVRYVPESIVYHRHHASMKKFSDYREHYLLERNALMALYKNLDDESLALALPGAMALAVRRGIARAGVDGSVLDLQRSPGDDDVQDVVVPKTSLTGAYAIDFFTEHLAGLSASRREVQARRRRPDRAVFPLFRHAIEPAYGYPSYLAAHEEIVRTFGIDRHFISRRRVLVVTGEPLTQRMAGPAIRAWEIARALSAEQEVRLASTAGNSLSDDAFEVLHVSGRALREVTDWADVIIFQGFLLEAAPWLKDSSKILVADVYDPMHLEQLEQSKDIGPAGRALAVRETTRVLNEQLRRADLLLCASEKQRDFWLGQLAGQGRVSPELYDEDVNLDQVLAVTPFGIPDTPPVQQRSGIRGVVDGIGPDDKVILWGGGVYNWFDPLTLLHAVDRLRASHPDVRLYFLGLKHPNPGVPHMRMAWETKELAERLGLAGTHVFFNHGWVPYAQRADYLLDADVGVSTHFQNIETRFSFRTRILDYLWASLPIVATEGDRFSDLVREHGLGRVVPERDVDALAAALEEMLYDQEAASAARARIAEIAPQFTWSRTLRPLVEYCRDPRRALDLVGAVEDPDQRARAARRPRPRFRDDVVLARAYLVAGGPAEVLRRAGGRIRRVLLRRRIDD